MDEIKKNVTLGKKNKEEDLDKLKEVEIEYKLLPIKNFTDILDICFKMGKKEHAYFLIKKSIDTPGIIDKSVFEKCLDYNEDIAM